MGAVARTRWGAPYGVLRRSTLQSALLNAVKDNPLCRLHLGKRIESATVDVIAATTFRDHDLIVGADGVWSAARFAVPSAPTATFSGNIAWRSRSAKTTFHPPSIKAPSRPISVRAAMSSPIR